MMGQYIKQKNMKHTLKKLDKLINKYYKPFAYWLISLNNKEDVDWLNMHNNMVDDESRQK